MRDCPVLHSCMEIRDREASENTGSKPSDGKLRKGKAYVINFTRAECLPDGEIVKEIPVGDAVEVDIDESAPMIEDCHPEDEEPDSAPVEHQDFKIIKVKASQLQQQPSEPSGQVPSHLVLLDNQAEVSIFRNKDLLTNLREADTNCHISGIVS